MSSTNTAETQPAPRPQQPIRVEADAYGVSGRKALDGRRPAECAPTPRWSAPFGREQGVPALVSPPAGSAERVKVPFGRLIVSHAQAAEAAPFGWAIICDPLIPPDFLGNLVVIERREWKSGQGLQ